MLIGGEGQWKKNAEVRILLRKGADDLTSREEVGNLAEAHWLKEAKGKGDGPCGCGDQQRDGKECYLIDRGGSLASRRTARQKTIQSGAIGAPEKRKPDSSQHQTRV